MSLNPLHVLKAVSGAAASFLVRRIAEGWVAKATLSMQHSFGGMGRGDGATAGELVKFESLMGTLEPSNQGGESEGQILARVCSKDFRDHFANRTITLRFVHPIKSSGAQVSAGRLFVIGTGPQARSHHTSSYPPITRARLSLSREGMVKLSERARSCSLTGSWQRVLTTSIIPGSLCWLQQTGRRPSRLYRGRLPHPGSLQRRDTISTMPVSRCPLMIGETKSTRQKYEKSSQGTHEPRTQ